MEEENINKEKAEDILKIYQRDINCLLDEVNNLITNFYLYNSMPNIFENKI